MARPNYVIYAPAFDPNSGGAIFLHELVNALRNLGEDATIWPWWIPRRNLVARVKATLRRPSSLWRQPKFATSLMLDTPLASESSLRTDTIVVYPEVTLGNPLMARNVVRWLLYRPGLRDPFQFEDNEMFFRAGEMSDLPELTGGAPDLFVWRINHVYRNEERVDRKGACYILRKGADKPRIPETANAIPIDGLSHEEIAEIFNRSEKFYSYDEATFYSQYAAICGCTSIVIPGLYASRDEWVANHPIARFGVAYGADDIAHALDTQHRVGELLREKESEGLASVEAFVSQTQRKFA